MIGNGIDGNAAYPAFKCAIEAVLIQPLKDPVEGFALNILCSAVVTGEAADDSKNKTGVMLIQLALGSTVITATGEDELLQPFPIRSSSCGRRSDM